VPVLDDLHDLADKCTLAFDLTGMKVGLMQTVLRTLGRSYHMFGENWTMVQVEKLPGLYCKCRHARVIEEKQPRPDMLKIYLVPDELQRLIRQKIIACFPYCIA
jgi:hypothetical protein